MAEELEQHETRGRKPRQTREAEQKKVSWRPPELLPSPEPEEGYVFRWIRISALGHDDVSNISARLREGYEPVKASEHPEVQVVGSIKGRYEDCIVYGGLMLCKIPKEIAEQRDAYYREQAKSQLKSVDNNFMRENDSRMPLFNERKSETKFGSGSN